MRRIVYLWCFLGMCFNHSGNAYAKDERWAVYYLAELPPQAFMAYDTLVFDADVHPDITPLLQEGKTLLAYISIGEVGDYRPYFKTLQEQEAILEVNPHWQGAFYLDVRSPYWQRFVTDELIPGILQKGFHGVFLDTVDTPVELERRDPEGRAGMRVATIRLIKSIRQRYPDMPVMMNRGYGILPQVGKDITLLLGESVYTTHDAGAIYKKVAFEAYQSHKALLLEARRLNPQLKIYTLDYWEPEDRETIREIYTEERRNGFIPYVATRNLDSVIPEQ